jgi:hypothetical protein
METRDCSRTRELRALDKLSIWVYVLSIRSPSTAEARYAFDTRADGQTPLQIVNIHYPEMEFVESFTISGCGVDILWKSRYCKRVSANHGVIAEGLYRACESHGDAPHAALQH